MTKNKSELTPMMRQFYDLKTKHPDAILLFRCGDFYETYAKDAIVSSGILGLTLTHRSSKSKTGQIEMAGFPHHALDTYLPRLVRAGYRVAICDQLEDPKQTKTLVKRGITELVTPGVVLGDSALNSRENNFLASIYFSKTTIGLSLLDISTGEYLVAEGQQETIDKLLSGFSPKEILVLRGNKQRATELFGSKAFFFELEDWAFSETLSSEKLCKQFHTKNLKGFGVEHMQAAIVAAGAILCYLELTQHTQIGHITRLQRIEEECYVRLDKFTIRNLELVRPLFEDGVSLLQILDRTKTPMGARLLHRWTLFPLRNVKEITHRHDAVAYFYQQESFCDDCQTELSNIGDLERIVSKIAVKRVTPRELQQARIALECILRLKDACLQTDTEPLQKIGQQLDACQELHARIAHDLQLDPPNLINKGGVIATGVNNELDELRSLSGSSKEYLQHIRDRESERTGISSLKIGFNNVFGYYIEVRNTYKDKVPEEWIRKQTLVQAERYITQELKDYEEKILGAEDRILALETRLYNELVDEASKFIALLQRNAHLIASLDALYALSVVAKTYHYVRPQVDESDILSITAGRHPVIETMMPPGEEYVPNDIYLDHEKQQIIIITGPNMAGKSALLRQTALITLLAQIGSFVPAQAAHIGLVDKIFTRVGASDNISMGESTFMVEMNEAANIMNNLTPKSLVLFDELGRGTSTYDGISIAWSIVEYLHENPTSQARTLFATHYHELNEMEKRFSRIKNWNVSVKEVNGKIVFLRKLMRGGSEHSFGIHVAQLAGMPLPIVKQSEKILKQLEQNNAQSDVELTPISSSTATTQHQGIQMSFFQLDDPVLQQIRDEILTIDINHLTPLEALNKLHDIRTILTGKKES